ncbi:hypothetical protein VdG2_00218 [Verticillium dahliae VDG2]|nr:hypothetical protein VdG2_00218 [Verticillium dahliae VDG2]
MDVSKVDDWNRLRLRCNWDSPSTFEEIVNVNFYGVIRGIAVLKPLILQQSGSALVITGSKQGITNPPGNPAYNASNAAVRRAAEHLAWDLRDRNVNIYLLVPGWAFTSIGSGGVEPINEKDKPTGAWTIGQVVEYLEESIARKEFYIICPDNDVTVEMNKKRMMWTAQDLIHRRRPLSRWREDLENEFNEWSSKPLE